MATHGSATVREQAPHLNQPTRTKTILHALTRRAQTVLNDKSIDAESRAHRIAGVRRQIYRTENVFDVNHKTKRCAFAGASFLWPYNLNGAMRTT
jgi:hypothetical protein